jgi:hypothetical protein
MLGFTHGDLEAYQLVWLEDDRRHVLLSVVMMRVGVMGVGVVRVRGEVMRSRRRVGCR